MTTSVLRTLADLEAVYGEPSRGSLAKEIDHLSPHYRAFVEHAPFVLVASAGPGGLDCSPRGDAPGFVSVADARTLLLPDRRGNNRVDTLRNVIADPRIALLFLVPGVGETLRVNGTAEIDVDPALLASFAVDGKAPRSVLRVHVERVYFQCQKALARSRLWEPDSRIERSRLPSAGEILAALDREVDAAAYDAAYPERMRQTIY
ncbi:pyridoxamine 5'-phosphate oxidase family protein [Aurantimonas sp. HBX-1]|uniref:pyridoxamine 5'-phosphate oxidase family protein n=1 Tax=Aurantimonas sp. HBX-1 TaxID=2906072 RepID=UPI001F26146F|nr:pyridoxamine 5'-phosphate oxidase family protein [Aurantimonas sp. HBX-1]UIJ73238.1 pyridoxamine 5'-phosphate oxidase family protein [Aurantimonas sp. HBX-1]